MMALPIPEHIFTRLKIRLQESRAGSVTLWIDDEGRIFSADFDSTPVDHARYRALIRRAILEVLAERDSPVTGKRLTPRLVR